MPAHNISAVIRIPFGRLKLFSNGSALTRILLPSQLDDADTAIGTLDDDILRRASVEFRRYFEGQLTHFETPCKPKSGTAFQNAVWNELRRIPSGTTISYSELATRIRRPNAVRAVGAANGRNPLPIVLPCHRVIGADGSLTGYAGGLPLKRQLLDLERTDSRHCETDSQLVAG